MKLSAAFLVGNENVDRLLPLAIDQVQRFADEVVVVTNATDGSADVCRRQGARVTERAWPGSYSKQANYCFSLCSGDYILYLGADELIADEFESWHDRLEWEGWPELVSLPTYNFVRTPGEPIRIRLGLNSTAPWYPEYHIRLFRNTPYAWMREPLHEGLVCPGGRHVQWSDIHIFHYGWARHIDMLNAHIARRNAEEKALGQAGTHTLDEPFSDREDFTGRHPQLFHESVLDPLT